MHVEDLSELRKFLSLWYNNEAVKFELSKQLFNREFAVIDKTDNNKTVRMFKCHNTDHFKYIMNTLVNMEKTGSIVNLYYSLAKYKNGIPNQQFRDLDKRKKDNNYWSTMHFEEMISYDFLLDVDMHDQEDFDYGYEATNEIKEFFDDYQVPYYLRYSGCGFHIVVPYQFMPQLSMNPYEKDNIYQFYAKLGKFFNREYSDLVDYRIYDSRRLCKLPYSLSAYLKPIHAKLCYPILNDVQWGVFGSVKQEALDSQFCIPELVKYRGENLFNKKGETTRALMKITEVI